MKYSRFTVVSLLLLFCLFISITPRANAPPTLQSKITEVYTFGAGVPGDIAVDVTSNGTVFVNFDSDFYRSDDFGVTWAKVKENADSGSTMYFLRVDSQDRIFAASIDKSGTWIADVWRSDDYGLTWLKVIDNTPRVWRLAEMSNGTLLINTYSTPGSDHIWKSNDGGLTWSVWQNLTAWGNGHIHFVRVNPYNDDIWVGLGDESTATVPTVVRWNAGDSSWTFIYNTTTDWMYTDVLFDSTYTYLMPDRSAFAIQRLPHRGTWEQKVEVMDLYRDDTTSPTGIPFCMMGAVYDDGLMIVPTDRETVYASVDGIRWLKIFQTTYSGSGAWRLDYISQQRDVNGYWYFVNDYTGKVYRTQLTADDVRQTLVEKYTKVFGIIGTEKMQISVENSTNISFNITDYNIQQFQVAIVGLTRGNHITNPQFETGDLSGWKIGGTSAGYGITTTDKNDGSYSLQVNKTTVDQSDFWIETTTPVKLYSYSERWFAFVYAKANQSVSSALKLEIGYYDEQNTWNILRTNTFSFTTSWSRRTTASLQSTTEKLIHLRLIVRASTDYNYTAYLDTLLLERKVGNYYINKVNDGDTVVYKTGVSTPIASTSLYSKTETKNVHISISDQTAKINYVGNLSEGVMQIYSYTRNKSIFDIHTTVDGSKQVLLIISFSENPHIIFSTGIVQTSNFSNEKLSFNVSAPSETPSTTKVYCGVRGEPIAIYTANGTQTWSYNASTTILTLNVTHESPTRILVYWKFPGDTDNDGDVDIYDLYILAVAYGSHVEEPNYHSNSDIDGNNHVNCDDLCILAGDYGELKP